MADTNQETGTSVSDEKPSRAELRRRKILNSSADRLAKLTGKSDDRRVATEKAQEDAVDSTVNEVKEENQSGPDSEFMPWKESQESAAGWETRFMEDTEVPGSQEEDWENPEEFKSDESKLNKTSSKASNLSAGKDCMEGDESIAGWETRFMEDTDVPGSQEEDWVDPHDAEEELESKTRMSKMSVNILRLLFLVALAVTINILILYRLEHLIGHAIFSPFALVEGIMWCCELGFKKESTVLSSVLMMCGIPPGSVRSHTSLVGALSTCCSDYCVYFFTFIMVNRLFESVF